MKNIITALILLFFHCTSAQTNEEVDRQLKSADSISNTDVSKSIQLYEEINRASRMTGYKKGILKSNLGLMSMYGVSQKFDKFNQFSKETEKLAFELNDPASISKVIDKNISYLINVGFYEQALQESRRSLEFVKMINDDNEKRYMFSLVYYKMGAIYSRMYNYNRSDAHLDSSLYYHQKSLKEAEMIDKNYPNYTYKRNSRILSAYSEIGNHFIIKNEPDSTSYYLTKGFEFYQQKKEHIYPEYALVILTDLADYYIYKKDYEKALQLLEQAMELKYYSTAYDSIRIYSLLKNLYKETGNQEKELLYIKKYARINDSLSLEERKRANTSLDQLLSVRAENAENQRNILVFIVTGSVLLFGLLGFLLWKRYNRKLHKNYEILINNLKEKHTEYVIHEFQKKRENSQEEEKNYETEFSETGGNNSDPSTIPEKTYAVILKKLQKFERSEKYTRKELSLTSMASDFRTNTRYLSEIINRQSGQNFNHYINGLRIGYILNKLYTNPIYREYKINYLAEECGFSSRKVFSTFFQKETGISPSYFIENLKKDNGNNAKKTTEYFSVN